MREASSRVVALGRPACGPEGSRVGQLPLQLPGRGTDLSAAGESDQPDHLSTGRVLSRPAGPLLHAGGDVPRAGSTPMVVARGSTGITRAADPGDRRSNVAARVRSPERGHRRDTPQRALPWPARDPAQRDPPRRQRVDLARGVLRARPRVEVRSPDAGAARRLDRGPRRWRIGSRRPLVPGECTISRRGGRRDQWRAALEVALRLEHGPVDGPRSPARTPGPDQSAAADSPTLRRTRFA